MNLAAAVALLFAKKWMMEALPRFFVFIAASCVNTRAPHSLLLCLLNLCDMARACWLLIGVLKWQSKYLIMLRKSCKAF
jgi:hypothetical protein